VVEVVPAKVMMIRAADPRWAAFLAVREETAVRCRRLAPPVFGTHRRVARQQAVFRTCRWVARPRAAPERSGAARHETREREARAVRVGRRVCVESGLRIVRFAARNRLARA
jgi:hypothetical protein